MILQRASKAIGPRPQVATDPESAGWEYIAFAAYKLAAGDEFIGETGPYETGIVVLGGMMDFDVAGGRIFQDIGSRSCVWERTPPVAALLPPGARYTVRAKTDLHIAVAGAKVGPDAGVGSASRRPPRIISPGEMTVEERGEGQTYRRIHHILPPTADAAALILVEVYTPAGNWSSFPPHKHDTEDPPREAYLEEVYYFQIHPPEGFALQRVYTDDGSLDEAAAPGDGDLVKVPKGYHPVAAMPGYDCYYLNVMAGPTKAWNFTVDSRYAWLMNWKKPPVAGGES